MKRCLAVILVTLSLGLLANSSRAQSLQSRTYKPCFEDPVFEEAAFTRPHFVEPEFEPGKRVEAQMEKPVMEIQFHEIPQFEKPSREKPEFVEPEFDNACAKTTASVSTAPRIMTVTSFAPHKITLMQPLVAQKTGASTKTAFVSRSGSRLLAVSKLR
jgi:hypothetical protein